MNCNANTNFRVPNKPSYSRYWKFEHILQHLKNKCTKDLKKLNTNLYFTERQWTKEYLTIVCCNTKYGKHDDRDRHKETRYQTKST